MLNVGQLNEGFVLDHIEAGKSMMIYNNLGLGELDCQVAIIKIEGGLDLVDLDVLGFIDHNITVNIIKDGQIVDKKSLSLPKQITNVIKCKKTDKNRTVRINQELTSMHQEVIENLESIHGALLRMNRSIQAEGTFGIMKNDRWYKRIVRRGIHSVKLEVLLVAIGHNLYKYQKKR